MFAYHTVQLRIISSSKGSDSFSNWPVLSSGGVVHIQTIYKCLLLVKTRVNTRADITDKLWRFTISIGLEKSKTTGVTIFVKHFGGSLRLLTNCS